MNANRVKSITIIQVVEWIAMCLSLTGNYFVNQKDVLGMWIWLIGSTTWMLIALRKKDWPQMIMFFVYSGYNIDGIVKWS